MEPLIDFFKIFMILRWIHWEPKPGYKKLFIDFEFIAAEAFKDNWRKQSDFFVDFFTINSCAHDVISPRRSFSIKYLSCDKLDHISWLK